MFLINPYIYSTTAWENLKSISLDGIDEYVDCGTVTELSNVANFSVSLWIKQPVTGSTDVIFDMYKDVTNVTSLFYRGDTALHGVRYLQMIVSNGTGGTYEYTGQNILPSGWSNLVTVYDGSLTNANRIKIYKNGSLLTTTTVGTLPTTTPTFTTEPLTFGGRTGGTLPIQCNLDEPAIFDYALTSGEVTSIYNSGCPDNLMDLAAAKRPEHYYPIDGSTYPTVDDLGETGGNDGTMTNMESGDIQTDTPC